MHSIGNQNGHPKPWARLLAMLLAMLMLLSCAFAEESDEDDDDFVEEDDEIYEEVEEASDGKIWIEHLLVIDGQLFGLADQRLFRVDETAGLTLAATLSELGYPAACAVYGNTVYLLKGGYGDPFEISTMTYADGAFSEPKQAYTLDMTTHEDEWINIVSMVITGEDAYLLIHSDTLNQGWDETSLYRVALSNGAMTKIADGHWKSLQLYKNGLLCAYEWDVEKAFTGDGEIITPTVVSLNPATGEAQTLFSLTGVNQGGVVYDADADSFFFLDASKLYGVLNGGTEPTLVAYLTPGYNRSDTKAVLAQGRYWYIDDGTNGPELASASTDPSALPSTVLHVAASWASTTMVEFSQEHPEIAIDLMDENLYSSADDITTRMTSADSSADVYQMSMNYSAFSALRDKGYVVDLSGSQKLMDSVAAMYPNLTAQILEDGHLWAYPDEAYVSSIYGYYPEVLEEVGMTVDDLPHTYSELVDFCVRWIQDYAEDYPDISLFYYIWNLRQQLFYEVIQQQSALCAFQGVPLTFNTPAIREFLQKLEQAGPILDTLNPPEDQTNVMYVAGNDAKALLTSSASVAPSEYGRYGGDEVPMTLTIAPDDDFVLVASMEVLLINPNSQNREAALTYLEFVADHLADATRIVLMPDYHEPKMNPYYEDNVKYAQEWLQSAQENLNENPDDREAQEALAEAQRNLEDTEKDKWFITEEEIDAFHEQYAPHMTVVTQNVFTSSGSEELTSLLQRYLEGQLPADQLLQQMNRILQMIQFENQ